MTHDEAGRFLARWAKRKRAANERAEKLERPAPVPDDPPREPPAAAGDEGGDAKSPLPDVEALGAGSDFRPFMAQGVPDDVRNRALRKLWRSNPLYARIDMLDDYCEDYTDARCAVPGVASLYRVGRGFAEEMVRADEEGAPRDEASSENETSEDPSGDEEPRKESTKTTRDA